MASRTAAVMSSLNIGSLQSVSKDVQRAKSLQRKSTSMVVNATFEENRGEVTSFREAASACFKKASLTLAAAAAALSLQAAQVVSPVDAAVLPNPAIGDLGVLITGKPISDAKALLRYALPIDNKDIQNVQLSLESISDDLRVPGVKAFDGVEKHIRQANRALNQGRDSILKDVAPTKKAEGAVLLDKLQDGLQEFQKVVEKKDRASVPVMQKATLAIVGDIEEAMVDKFPYEISADVAKGPVLKGRAHLQMVIRTRNNPNLPTITFDLVVDGYNAPVTAGNFVDLVQRKFYDGMEIQRADGFVVQTGDPGNEQVGFIDSESGEIRRIPLEIFVQGDKEPTYHETLEELGLYKSLVRLPFNAFGTMAMARDEFDNDSASSQVFWLLKESELTPSSSNILDGRYAVFGYITENEEQLADVKVGDVIESVKVTEGLDNLVYL